MGQWVSPYAERPDGKPYQTVTRTWDERPGGAGGAGTGANVVLNDTSTLLVGGGGGGPDTTTVPADALN